MDENEILEHVKQCYLTVVKGGTKVSYENDKLSVTAYRVGVTIRIDIKVK